MAARRHEMTRTAGVRPLISFLADFGSASAAACQGVVLGICPEASIVVISHQITRYSIAEGAGTLAVTLPSMASSAVRVCGSRPSAWAAWG
jgi:S-adenosylmethionine hydrolase